MKILNSLLICFIVASSCQKDDTEPNVQPTSAPTSAQTMTLPVYLGEAALITYFDNTVPMIRMTESGTTEEITLLINTCSNVNGNAFTLKHSTSYDVVFGLYVDGTWAQWEGFYGTITVDANGNIDGTVGVGVESVLAAKANNYGGCGFTISGDILLFF